MPQPLYRVNKRAAFVINSPTVARPAFSPLIADVIVAGAGLEVWLGSCLAQILGTSAEIGIAMYTALSSGSAQRDVINAAAKYVLKGDDLYLFLALLDLAFKASRPRNHIAHGIWGYSNDLPDAILFIPPRIYLQYHAKPPALARIDLNSIMVYTERDFREIIERITVARNNLQSFWIYLDPKQTQKVRDQWHQKLCSQPDVQKALRRSEKGLQSNPSVPRLWPDATLDG